LEVIAHKVSPNIFHVRCILTSVHDLIIISQREEKLKKQHKVTNGEGAVIDTYFKGVKPDAGPDPTKDISYYNNYKQVCYFSNHRTLCEHSVIDPLLNPDYLNPFPCQGADFKNGANITICL